MACPAILLLLAAVSFQETEIDEAVKRLTSDTPEERGEALARVLRLGRKALPALVIAADDARGFERAVLEEALRELSERFGDRLAYLDGDDLVTVALNGEQKRTEAPGGTDASLRSAVFSPDGKWLAMWRGSDLLTAEMGDGNVSRWDRAPTHSGCGRPVWDRDSKKVLATYLTKEFDGRLDEIEGRFVMVDAVTGRRSLISDRLALEYGWSFDGSRLWFIAWEDKKLWFYSSDAAGKETRRGPQLFRLPVGARTSPLGVSYPEGKGFTLVRLDTLRTEHIDFRHQGPVVDHAWSPDGRTFAYALTDGLHVGTKEGTSRSVPLDFMMGIRALSRVEFSTHGTHLLLEFHSGGEFGIYDVRGSMGRRLPGRGAIQWVAPP